MGDNLPFHEPFSTLRDSAELICYTQLLFFCNVYHSVIKYTVNPCCTLISGNIGYIEILLIWCQPMFFIPDSKKFLHWITDISKSRDIHIIVNEIIMCIRSHHYLLKDHSVLIPTLSKMIGTFQQVRSGVVFSGDHFRGISADKHRTCQHQQVTMFLVLCQDIVLGIAQGKLLHADNNANFMLAR